MYQPKTESIFFLLEFAGCADYDNKLIRVVYQYQLTSMVKYLSVTVRNYAWEVAQARLNKRDKNKRVQIHFFSSLPLRRRGCFLKAPWFCCYFPSGRDLPNGSNYF